MKIYELRENGALKDPRLAYRSMVELGFRITWLSPAVAPVVMANHMIVAVMFPCPTIQSVKIAWVT